MPKLYFYKNVRKDLKETFFDHYIKMPYLEHTKTNPSEMVRNTLLDVDGAVSYMENINIMIRGLMALIVIFTYLSPFIIEYFIDEKFSDAKNIIGILSFQGFFYGFIIKFK